MPWFWPVAALFLSQHSPPLTPGGGSAGGPHPHGTARFCFRFMDIIFQCDFWCWGPFLSSSLLPRPQSDGRGLVTLLAPLILQVKGVAWDNLVNNTLSTWQHYHSHWVSDSLSFSVSVVLCLLFFHTVVMLYFLYFFTFLIYYYCILVKLFYCPFYCFTPLLLLYIFVILFYYILV